MTRAKALFYSWSAMKSRCYNPARRDYQWYGGKGIVVCKEWQSFKGFLRDMGTGWFEGATIGRKDHAKGYCKDNCEWQTRQQQGPRKCRSPEQITQIKELRAKGYHVDKIAFITGISRPTLVNILRECQLWE